MDKIEGVLEVGHNDKGEVVINHPDLKPDQSGVGHIVFSPTQARHLAMLLNQKASEAERETRDREEAATRKAAEAIPVDRNARVLSDGSPETPDHLEIDPKTGQQKGYVVLTAEERAKGFVRPVRRTYLHIACGTTTTMGMAIAETYARDPKFYSGTFCVHCRAHFPIGETGEFKWEDGTMVGT